MLGKLLPVLLALAGLGAGVGGGIALRPDPQEVAIENPCGDPSHSETDTKGKPPKDEKPDDQSYDYVKLNNQFVVPIVEDGRVASLVVMSLSLEVSAGLTADVYQLEPKIRDVLLQVLFDHANAGGFSGSFTKSTRMNALRVAMLETVQKVLGEVVSDVLVIDVVRQDA